MDIVITYVNGLDPEWLADYAKYTDIPVMTKRFRDWGTLPYLLRGIEQNLPFVENVFLVLAAESQVPQWLNKDTVKVVYHRDFVPQEYLPTFNSNSIESFLHCIPGLGERFLYFNDDMFPMLPSKESDFFPEEGRIRIGFSTHLLRSNMYRKICANSDALVRKALNIAGSPLYVRPQHICSPMLKSANQALYSKMESQIRQAISRTRLASNYTQYIYLDYLYYLGKVDERRISNKHFSVAFASEGELSKFLSDPDRNFCCINDVHLSDAHYLSMRESILTAFAKLFPQKSKFEL
ncbi:MAG: stealth family protein [Candidatus Cryptobacteroides sp.]